MGDIYNDHGILHGRSETTLAVTIAMLVLCTIFVALRMLSRVALIKKVSVDDYFMLLAWVITVGLCASICIGTRYGLGRHERQIPASWQPALRKSGYAFSVMYQPALMATKTSILAFYLTFSGAERLFRWACYTVLFVVNAGGLALTLVTVLQCDPVSAAFYAVPPPQAQCTDILTIYLSSIPLNIITDLAILFLPMPILTAMRLPKKQKLILVVTFSFGIFVAAVDVLRIHYLQSAATMRLSEIANMESMTSSRNSITTDSSFYLAFSFMWSAIECTVGIMCACVPGLKPLVARFMPSMLRSPDDEISRFGSFSILDADAQTASSQVPDIPPDVHYHDFGRSAHANEIEEGQRAVGIMDFLTTPDMNGFHSIERSTTALTNTSRHTAPRSPTFFDFVVMKQKKSLVHMTTKESIYPLAIVTVLFFIWGFEYGLVEVLNRQFQSVANVTTAQAVGIRSAFYCGYLVGPITVGRWTLKHWGFKACFPLGLSIYGCGCLIFWPAAVLTSWPTFLVTNFIVAFGLSLLEVSANPFILLCGPAQYAEIRLNLSQAVQAVGGIVAPLIASKAFYHTTANAPTLINTQWAYLGISLSTFALAVVYFYVPLPEATDAELEDSVERLDGANKAKFGEVHAIWYILGLGVFSQFCYVGAQEVIGTSFVSYLHTVAPELDTTNFFAIAHTAFAVSRFLAAGAGFWISPRVLLLMFYSGTIIFSALCTHFTGRTGVAMMIMVFFCEGPLFSLIFGQALRGQGRHSKFASVLVTAAIGGGAIFSPISSALVAHGRSVPYSLVVAVAAFSGGIVFAFGLNLSRTVRLVVDPLKEHSGSLFSSDDRPGSHSSRASRAFSLLSIAKHKRNSGCVEYRERKGSAPTG